MRYVDGFVIAIPKKNLAAYKKMAKAASKVWMEHGAVQYVECVGEDMAPSFGVAFPKLAKCKPGETVVFSWIAYRSRSHRDKVNAKVMKDPRIAAMCDPNNMPFSMKRMSYGGFEAMVDV